MPDSRELDVLKRLTAHIQGITPDFGYEFDLSDSVFRGRLDFGDDDPDTLVSIVEYIRPDVGFDPVGFNKVVRERSWVLLVQGWLKHDGDNPTDRAYQLKASVEKRLSECIVINENTGNPVYPDLYFLGLRDTITEMSIGSGAVSVALRPESSSRAFFYIPLGIGLAVDVSDPFVEA